jgi:DNA-binding LacI/PurR family transcriptional regulator
VLFNINSGHYKPVISLPSAFEQVKSQGATAVVLVDVYSNYSAAEIADFYASGAPGDIPTVVVAARTLHGPVPYVSANISYSGYLAAEHLLKQGVEELTFATCQWAEWVDERIAYARQAVAQLKFPEDMLKVVCSNSPVPYMGPTSAVMESADVLVREMIATGTLRGGIIAANDYVAHAILRAAGDANLLPGRDFLIVGVDDAKKSMSIGLSTVRPPLEELGHEANLLLNRAVRHQATGVQVILRPQLIIRSSSRWIAGNELIPSQQTIGETMK